MNYDDEVFKFVTTKENFKSAFEVYAQLPAIKERLVSEFWQLVFEKLKSIIKDQKLKFNVSLEEKEIFLDVCNSGYGSIGIYCTNLNTNYCYGIYYNEDKYNNEEIDKYIDDNDLTNWSKNSYWIFWVESEESFEALNLLMKILPENRNNFASELVADIISFVTEYKKDIFEISKFI